MSELTHEVVESVDGGIDQVTRSFIGQAEGGSSLHGQFRPVVNDNRR